jgi:hypothetical protein
VKLLLDENLSPKVAEALAREDGLHAGIVLIEQGDLTREEQLDLMRRVAAKPEHTDLVNHVLRVDEDGTMTVEPVPAP